MKKIVRNLALAALVALAIAPARAGEGVSVLEHTVKNIDGEDVNLGEKYKGQVLLIVNVASKCGLTPQYEQLAELDAKYREKGLRILGFPANNFGAQEPGTEAEIKEFCSTKYDVKFDMFKKISVKGDDIAPLFKDLTDEEKNGEFGGDIKWNFTKFLVGRDGRVIKRIEPRTKPDADDVIAAIEAALDAK